ncbi:MAG: 2-oxoacid:acceptor oxidoreductase family protein [Elusimicrobiota bacterium]
MNFNIYINGVGGQGVGILAAVLGESLISAGYEIMGCDTHGLAQRHGSVSSHIRAGKNIFHPLIDENEADFVLSLERLEALRGAENMLKSKGILIFYDSVYQPISVRTGEKKYPSLQDLEKICFIKKAVFHKIKIEGLKDFRKQNTALISVFVSLAKIPGLTHELILSKLKDYIKYDIEENIKIYERAKVP